MTREECIKRLEYTKLRVKDATYSPEAQEALDMAIRSLEAWDDVKSEIKEWYWSVDKQALAKDPCVVDAMVDLFIRTINKHLEKVNE